VQILLRTRLGMPAGLADPRVRLLDPAAGSMNFIRAAWRIAMAAGNPCPGAHLLTHFTGIELLPKAHARGIETMRRFLKAAGCSAGPEALSTIRADALAPPPEILEQRFNVVIGNPPWRGGSGHRGAWIESLVQEYFRIDGESLGERNPKWLHDEYVKFLRLAQWLIDQNGEGIAALVLNHNFLDAPTFRGLRRSLLRSFQEIYALDLHGNHRRRESGNVFAGVAQGASVLFLVRKTGLPRRVLRADLHGSRRDKLKALARSDAGTTPWTDVEPRAPGWLFVAGDRAIEREYRRGLALPEIFPVHGTGIVTGRDAEVTALDRDTLRHRFGADLEDRITCFLARPFDLRFILYAEGFVTRPRRALMSHLLSGGNVGLIVPRQHKEEPGALVTRWLPGHKVISAHDVSSFFPLYLETGVERRPNLAPGLTRRLGNRYGSEPTPEAILGYVYAILYSESYRRRYRDLLRRSFPRITFLCDARRFAALAAAGRELIALHLLEDPRLQQARAIDPRVWDYRIGAYRVLPQWLRARRGRGPAVAESPELRRIAEALRLTREVQSIIEEVEGA
jgi:predicted helicase